MPARRCQRNCVAGIVFHQPAEPQNDDLLADRIVAAAGRWDRLLLLNGDELSGRLVGIAAGLVDFETELGSVKVAADRIRALIFKPATRRHEDKTERLRAWVGLCDGSRLLADRVVIAGKSLTLMASGRTWTTTPQRLVFLQPLGGRAVYLSDVRPADYRQTPFLDLPWPLRADRNVTGGMLRSAGRLWLKGLGVHSAARLVYTLDPSPPHPLAGKGHGDCPDFCVSKNATVPFHGTVVSLSTEFRTGPGHGLMGFPLPPAREGREGRGFQRFEAEIGIDDSAGTRGSVRFRVLVDGRERFASRVVRGGDRPTPVSVDLRGGKRLEILVDYADQGDVLDRADWLDARLIK